MVRPAHGRGGGRGCDGAPRSGISDGDRQGVGGRAPKAARVLRINPGFTIERHKRVWAHKDSTDIEHRLDGLRKAGLPES
jgi:hypothetical protein